VKANIILIQRDGIKRTLHVAAPPEWWELIRKGYEPQLEVPTHVGREAVTIVIHRDKEQA